MVGECRHGVPLRTTSIAFNDACGRCRLEREAFDRQTRVIGAQLVKRYRAGEFDRETEEHLDPFHDPQMSKYWAEFYGDYTDPKGVGEQLSEVWKRKRQAGIERRREVVEAALQQGVVLPEWLDEMFTECREEFTPRQVEALVYRYGFELTYGEAARVLGISRSAFQKRLGQAEAKVRHLRGDAIQERLDELEGDDRMRDQADWEMQLHGVGL
jgi:DNA-directed RNA polymerase specialized sigma24 family protein